MTHQAHYEDVDLDRLVLPPGEDFGIPSDYEVDNDDIELESGFGTTIGEFLAGVGTFVAPFFVHALQLSFRHVQYSHLFLIMGLCLSNPAHGFVRAPSPPSPWLRATFREP